MKTFNKVLALSLSLLVAILPVAQSSADVLSTTFYHNDALGSPVAATNENGNVKWREQYRPYGEKIVNELELSAGSSLAFCLDGYETCAPNKDSVTQLAYINHNVRV